jgi:flavodoxin
MGKVAVAYATKTGHSKKLAEAIGRALSVTPRNIIENPAPEATDLLILAGGIYGGESLPEMMAFAGSLDARSVTRAALVTSSASGAMAQKGLRGVLEEKGIPVVGEIIVPGALLVFRLGRPNRKDVEKAVAFAADLVKEGGTA